MEKFYGGQLWLKYLIDHFLRRGAYKRGSCDPQFREFTFDHEMNGIIVGEQKDNRELFILRVAADEVTRETLRRDDPDPWEPGYRGLDDRPWLAGERPWRSSLGFPPPELEQTSPRQSTRRRRIGIESEGRRG
jgi:hypothetical protein